MTVVAERRALLGDKGAAGTRLRAAENPLDLLLARGWISRELYDGGRAFGAWHGRARLGMPAVRTSRLESAVRGGAAAAPDAVALARLSAVWAALEGRPAAVNALIEVCIVESWPVWLRCAALAEDAEARAGFLADPRREALIAGLEAAAEEARRAAPKLAAGGTDLSRMMEQLRRPAG